MLAMNALAMPSRRDEAWRYSDMEAVARMWPQVSDVYGPYFAFPNSYDVYDDELTTHENPGAMDFLVSEGATRRISIAQITPPDADTYERFHIEIMKGGTVHFDLLNTGGRLGRIEIEVYLSEGASFTLNAVQIGSGAQTLEIVSTITHLEPNATSRQTVRSILSGGAVGTYLGKVAVARGAQGTDSEQSVRAMLLDRLSTANAVPELEIFADDVKCAHGCAVGELDAMSLFYLASRGLDEAAAKKLLLQAFIAELFDGQDALLEAAMARLEGVV
jgi:Fe-S cluster assembly protein SufD